MAYDDRHGEMMFLNNHKLYINSGFFIIKSLAHHFLLTAMTRFWKKVRVMEETKYPAMTEQMVETCFHHCADLTFSLSWVLAFRISAACESLPRRRDMAKDVSNAPRSNLVYAQFHIISSHLGYKGALVASEITLCEDRRKNADE